MGAFQEFIPRFAPSWFQQRWMRALLRAVGGELDNFGQRVFDGSRASNPYAGGATNDAGVLLQCDPDAFEYHARDRGIRMYDSEPELSKRVRLGSWRQLKKRRGSHQGELRNVQPFWLAEATSTLPVIKIVHQSNEVTPTATWHTLSATGQYSVFRSDPSNWDWDDQAELRSRFWAIIHLPAGYSTAIEYDDGSSVYDGGAIYDGVTALAINDLVDAFKEAKAAHSEFSGLILTNLADGEAIPGGGGATAFDPTAFSVLLPDGSTSLPQGNWGTSVDATTGLPSRPPWASFVYDVYHEPA